MPANLDPDQLHTALLRAFLDPAQNLLQIADAHGLSVQELTRWASSERTRADLEAFRQVAQLRAQVLAAAALPAAADNLKRLSEDLSKLQPGPEAPIAIHLRLADTIRKTATALQRLAKPTTTPATAAAPSTPRARDRPTALAA